MVYSAKLDLSKLNGKTSHDYGVWMLFSKLFLLAKYLQCPEFGNHLLDNALTRRDSADPKCSLPDPEIVTMIYNSTADECGIRRYFAAVYVWLSDDAFLKRQS